MKTIIVPTDFSKVSVNAAYYAAEIAMRIKAEILLLHVLPLPLSLSEVPLPPDSFDISLEEANQSLKALKEKLERYSNDKLCITYRITTDSFLEETENVNRQKDVFAMIMGTSGAGATEAFFLGSFSLTAARHLRHPLIVVPPGYQFRGIQKIGLACDMQNVSETVPFRSIREIFDHFDATLEILYVSKPTEKIQPQMLAATTFVQSHLSGLRPEIRITTNENPREGLENFVQTSGIDLLILVPKERNFVENIFHRSLTQKMVLHPEMPVLILH